MYVYLIKAGHKKTDPVKVGYSKDPEGRLKSLQTGNHEKLQLFMKIKCNDEKHARRLEKTSATQYRNRRASQRKKKNNNSLLLLENTLRNK